MNIFSLGDSTGTLIKERHNSAVRAAETRYETKVREAVSQALMKAGVSPLKAKLEFQFALATPDEGAMKVSASWWNPKAGDMISAKEVQIKDGAVQGELSDVARTLVASGTVSVTESATAKATPLTPYTVDATKLQAKRVGDFAIVTHENLPMWSFRASLSALKENRKDVETGIAVSIQGFCATQFERNAEITGEVKMPVVATTAPETAPVLAVEETPAPVNANVHQSEIGHNFSNTQPTKLMAGTVDNFSNASQAIQNAIQSYTHQAITAALSWLSASEWVKNPTRTPGINAGGQPRLVKTDVSGFKVDGFGVEGSILVLADFTDPDGIRSQATIEVPFDSKGRVIKASVGRTKADIETEKNVRAQLAIASDEEAKEIYKKFLAQQAAEEKKAKEMGIQATSSFGYNHNILQFGPHTQFPIRKNALPEQYSVAGKLIVMAGSVYELEPTDWNTSGIERGVHWMCRLRPDLSLRDADYLYDVSSGLGESIGAGA
jgi:hypothetical protein